MLLCCLETQDWHLAISKPQAWCTSICINGEPHLQNWYRVLFPFPIFSFNFLILLVKPHLWNGKMWVSNMNPWWWALNLITHLPFTQLIEFWHNCIWTGHSWASYIQYIYPKFIQNYQLRYWWLLNWLKGHHNLCMVDMLADKHQDIAAVIMGSPY